MWFSMYFKAFQYLSILICPSIWLPWHYLNIYFYFFMLFCYCYCCDLNCHSLDLNKNCLHLCHSIIIQRHHYNNILCKIGGKGLCVLYVFVCLFCQDGIFLLHHFDCITKSYSNRCLFAFVNI